MTKLELAKISGDEMGEKIIKLNPSPQEFLSSAPEREDASFNECCYAMRYLEFCRLKNMPADREQLSTSQDSADAVVIETLQSLVGNSMGRVNPEGGFFATYVIPDEVKRLKEVGIDSSNGGGFYAVIRAKKVVNLATSVHSEASKIIKDLDRVDSKHLLDDIWHPLFRMGPDQKKSGWSIEQALENLNIEGVSQDMIKKLLMLSGKHSQQSATELVSQHYYAGM